ncbi:MAG: glutamine--tRNA ligase/YqeY domain fusion protein [Candidatus Hydrogenedentota bacterium]|nr:MAG: glutamine--tRNA ligase/YqeY domain fusion protein [Candidatus Hydrogenedentota bacterium]
MKDVETRAEPTKRGLSEGGGGDRVPELMKNFIEKIIEEDLTAGRCSEVITRFPPEPNGYLHIGHAKSICLNFGLPRRYGGRCHLRFDDTNPEKEEEEFIEAIKRDVAWLGFDWGSHLYFASDYFERMYAFAEELIEKGLAFVCDQTLEEIRRDRGTLTEPGKESPYRNRSVEENLDLFRRMRKGEFPEGSRVLRAKIDMASPNLNMRDPVLYRIRRAAHPRTGTTWCIYPMYDFAHCLGDAIEGVTHSICTLEFEDHRPLYDWVLDNVTPPSRPYQYEFARLNMTYTVLSKRKLARLVREGHVNGWDDPRMPTLAGLRRRGVPPEAIRRFCDRIGVAKTNSVVEIELFEHCIREVLNKTARRVMAVLDPVKLTIENYPEDRIEEFEVENNPEDAAAGTRKVAFSRNLFIEREDFLEDPPKKFFRLAVGREVRLKGAYLVTCTGVKKDPETGEVKEVLCRYDPASRGGNTPDGRRVKGTIHWVEEKTAVPAEIRVYERLFRIENPEGAGEEFLEGMNENSFSRKCSALVEPAAVQRTSSGPMPLQFLRMGYFIEDIDSKPNHPIFNKTIGLRDTWAKVKR